MLSKEKMGSFLLATEGSLGSSQVKGFLPASFQKPSVRRHLELKRDRIEQEFFIKKILYHKTH